MSELAQGVLLLLPQQASNIQDLAKGDNYCPTQTQQANGQPKELPTNLTSLRPIHFGLHFGHQFGYREELKCFCWYLCVSNSLNLYSIGSLVYQIIYLEF